MASPIYAPRVEACDAAARSTTRAGAATEGGGPEGAESPEGPESPERPAEGGELGGPVALPGLPALVGLLGLVGLVELVGLSAFVPPTLTSTEIVASVGGRHRWSLQVCQLVVTSSFCRPRAVPAVTFSGTRKAT
jgi:hypothetical protein